jgi:hypothetical protein
VDRLQRRLAWAWHECAVTLKAASFAMVGVVNSLVDYSVFLSAYYLIQLPLIPAIRAGLARRGVRLLRDEPLHHLCG